MKNSAKAAKFQAIDRAKGLDLPYEGLFLILLKDTMATKCSKVTRLFWDHILIFTE